MNIYKKIYKEIKKNNSIVIARHIGADPDALGSTFGLKELILNTFPNKSVYVVGLPASKHKYIGELDNFSTDLYNNSLLIVLDTPDVKRVDGIDPMKFKYRIKIDHHPLVDKYCNIELIDTKSSSASQLIIELAFKTPLKISKKAAEKLFIGIVGDTNRFLYYYTTAKTFSLVSRLIKETNIDITKLYEPMYLRGIDEIKLQSYVIMNLQITDNGLGYIMLDQDTLDKLKTDAATMTNIVNFLTYIKEIIVWVIFAYDKNTELVRASLRSRGPVINEIASHFNGGGHIYASGARLNNFKEALKMVEELDLLCKEYKYEK